MAEPEIKKAFFVATVAPEKPTELRNANVLPTCVPREIRGEKLLNGIPSIQVFCANCGKPGPWVGKASIDFAFWLCNPCHDKYGAVAGCYAIPDEVFFERVKQAQLEREGRELTAIEIVEALKDPTHYLSKLVRDRQRHGVQRSR